MARGKVISVYLIDGVANGKIKATISNWNGIAYKIPRRLLDECKELEAFKQSGVYFLFGNNMVYVGQAKLEKMEKGYIRGYLTMKMINIRIVGMKL